MADDLETYKKYVELGHAETYKRGKALTDLFIAYTKEAGIYDHEMRCSRHSLCDIIALPR